MSSLTVFALISLLECLPSAGPLLREDRTATLEGVKEVKSLAFTPDGRTLILGGYSQGPDRQESGEVRLVEVATGTVQGGFSGHQEAVSTQAVSRDGKRLVTGADREVGVWELPSGKEVRRRELKGDRFARVVRVGFHPDGTRVIVVCSTEVFVWDPATDQTRQLFR